MIIRAETITEVVMIYRTLALDSTKTTVVVGEDKTFVRYRNTCTALRISRQHLPHWADQGYRVALETT